MSPYLLPFRFSLCKDQVAPGSVGPAGRIPLPGRPGLGTADRKEAWAQLLTVQSCHVNRKDIIPYFSPKNLLGEALRMLKCCFDKSKIPFYPLRIWVKNTGICTGPRTNQPTTHPALWVRLWRQVQQSKSKHDDSWGRSCLWVTHSLGTLISGETPQTTDTLKSLSDLLLTLQCPSQENLLSSHSQGQPHLWGFS